MNPHTAHLLSNLSFSRHPGPWFFRLEDDLKVYLGRPYPGRHCFHANGQPIARVNAGALTIFKGYAIDGCSPAMSVFGRRVGTPTPEATLPAAFVHDCLFQFIDLPCVPWDFDAANHIFRELLIEQKFRWANLYYSAVAALGPAYHRTARWLNGADHLSCVALHQEP